MIELDITRKNSWKKYSDKNGNSIFSPYCIIMDAKLAEVRIKTNDKF